MDASLIAIGRRADTTNALSIPNSHRAEYAIGYSALKRSRWRSDRAISESRHAEAEHERRARVMMIELQGPASIQGNSGTPCFASNARLFIIATAHRVSVGMDAVGPCVAVARAGGPREF
jgi:hypothetical protein